MAGPFGTGADPVAPAKPFLFLTKEAELHPALARAFEAGGSGGYRVVVPAAAHDSFTDGPRFQPRLLPIAGTADDVMTVTRGFLVAFLDQALRGGAAGGVGRGRGPDRCPRGGLPAPARAGLTGGFGAPPRPARTHRGVAADARLELAIALVREHQPANARCHGIGRA